ncbi:MAG: class II fructose-bisphosphate aldolase, partial [Planctomycetota bacterium]
LRVDYLAILTQAVELGYESVMVDGSRLPLDENIAATRAVVVMAHAKDVAVEAELGAVLGHETGPMPPYEELFASGKGFTDVEEATRFVRETGVDWLSVSIGNVHGAISAATRGEKKITARLNIERLRGRNCQDQHRHHHPPGLRAPHGRVHRESPGGCLPEHL